MGFRFFHWLRSLRNGTRTRPFVRRRKLELEQLEDRLAPAGGLDPTFRSLGLDKNGVANLGPIGDVNSTTRIVTARQEDGAIVYAGSTGGAGYVYRATSQGAR